jgi:hypothetical protein
MCGKRRAGRILVIELGELILSVGRPKLTARGVSRCGEAKREWANNNRVLTSLSWQQHLKAIHRGKAGAP